MAVNKERGRWFFELVSYTKKKVNRYGYRLINLSIKQKSHQSILFPSSLFLLQPMEENGKLSTSLMQLPHL